MDVTGGHNTVQTTNITTTADRRWLDREEKILHIVRQHLREAHGNTAVGDLVFRFEFKNGGIRKRTIKVGVDYEFVAGADALDERLG